MARSPSLRNGWPFCAMIIALFLAALLLSPLRPLGVAAADPCNPTDPSYSVIVCENSKPGSPSSEWDVAGSGSASIQGFSTDMSVNRGSTVGFKISSPQSSSFRLDIYRLGYYGGAGARKIAGIVPSDAARAAATQQPACLRRASTGLVDCGNWKQTAHWKVPSDAVSGMYLALLSRTDCPNGAGQASHIYFVVRADGESADIVVQASDTTWQAYNSYGGESFYTSASGIGVVQGHAYELSYNRPFTTRSGGTETDFIFYAEYPLIRFLESNGYSMTYISGVDTDRFPSVLNSRKVFISIGHDEYYSGKQVENLMAARDSGLNIIFMSGNVVYWKTRYGSSIDGSNTAYRTLICYKETWDFGLAGYVADPSGEWTGTWRDPRKGAPQPRPENQFTGTLTVSAGGDANRDMRVSYLYRKLRQWRNTAVQSLTSGQTITLGQQTIGYEWDSDLGNGFRPSNLIRLNSQTETNVGGCINLPGCYGQLGSCVTTCASQTHSLTLYRKGGLVFGAGTVQFVWGLDASHDGAQVPSNAAMRQFTVNMLADMGNVQPKTLASGLVAATPSSDNQAPIALIVSPSNSSSLPLGSVVVTGTATDSGGGVVVGVEISYDGGSTWHPADLTGEADTTVGWTYTVPPSGAGTLILLARATDDSANPGAATLPTVVFVQPCQIGCSLFGALIPPAADQLRNDPSAVELGTRLVFSSAVNITGIQFFKGGPANAGPHVGRLWRVSDQTVLASVTFTGESTSGWQSAALATPVAVSASASYIVSIHSPTGNYAGSNNFFSAATSSGPVTAPASSAAAPNGVYRYGAGGVFPSDTFQASNYWVDILYNV